MKNFVEKIDENSNYIKVYRFIQERFAFNEIIDEMTVWHRYYSNTKDHLNGEFSAHYRRAIRSLLQEGKIRPCAADRWKESYIIQQPEKEDKNKQEKENVL